MYVPFRSFPFRSAISRRSMLAMGASASALTLSGCSDMGSTFPPLSSGSPSPSSSSQPVSGDVIGSGPVRVGLILPLSSANGAAAAKAMRNAAEMALAEFNSTDLSILVKDDRGTPEGAQAAAQEAISQGAEAILGPLFAPTVQAVASVARASSRPVIAFSSDAGVASRGVYLLSFMPQSDVRRVLEYAGRKGKKSYAALIPSTSYGSVAEAEFTQTVAQMGARLVAVERYQPNKASAEAAVAKIKASASQIDALFIPDDGNGIPVIAAVVQAAGLSRVQMLGTGVWDEATVLKTPGVQGGWYAAPERTGYQNFSQRYRQRFNADPTRIATLSYDAVALVSALARTQGTKRFSEPVLLNASGFSGQDGIFRFRSDGTNDRGLAIYQIGVGGAQMVESAPRSFGGAA